MWQKINEQILKKYFTWDIYWDPKEKQIFMEKEKKENVMELVSQKVPS